MIEKVDNSTNLRNRNILFSLIAISGVVIMSFIYQGFSPDKPASKLSLSFFYIIIRYLFLWLAPLLFVFRLLKLLRKDSILIVFSALANIAIGLAAILMYFAGESEIHWLHDCLINLLVGFFLSISVFVKLR